MQIEEAQYGREKKIMKKAQKVKRSLNAQDAKKL